MKFRGLPFFASGRMATLPDSDSDGYKLSNRYGGMRKHNANFPLRGGQIGKKGSGHKEQILRLNSDKGQRTIR